MNSSFITIDYNESHVEEIVRMWRPSTRMAFGQESIHSPEDDVRFIKNELSKKFTILLAREEVNDRIIGMIAFSKDFVSQLYIDVDFLNQGIGTHLLNIAKERSSGILELFTFQRNQPAIDFYEKNGFFEIGRNFENELNLPDIKYCWKKL